jgi:hypothetical protein
VSRLVIFIPEEIDGSHAFIDCLTEARINPERQTFATAASTEELVKVLTDEGAEYALLAGNQPLQLVRPDLSTRYACGRPFFWGEPDWMMLATIHPEAVARNPIWRESVVHHLRTLVAWGRNPEDALLLSPQSCVSCLETVSVYDSNLLPWCATHARV